MRGQYLKLGMSPLVLVDVELNSLFENTSTVFELTLQSCFVSNMFNSNETLETV